MRLGQTSPNPVLSTMDISTMNIWRMSGSIVVRLINAGNLLNISSIRRNVRMYALCRVCPVHAITGGRKIPHIIDPQACIRCGTCMEKCKFGAIYVH